jgi:hypothetical protein
MNINDYWTLPLKEQEHIITHNPVTKCTICHKDEIRLVSCDACGESVCFECAIPCAGWEIKDATGKLVDLEEGIVLCRKCGVF